MNGELVSIIVPVYNIENYLEKCLDSIVNQTYENIEIILVNDGSTDSSASICERYASNDERINFINKNNEGLSLARQTGFNESNGKYLCTIDSDDYVELNFIEKLLYMIKHDKSDICVCAVRHYNNDFSKVYGVDINTPAHYKITKNDITNNYFDLLNRYYMSDSWNKMYRVEFIKKTNVNFTLDKKYNGTDLLFNHRLLLHQPKISVLNEPLYNHQLLENSRVRRKNKQLQVGFHIIMDELLKESDKLNYSEGINTQFTQLYVKFMRNAAQDIVNTKTKLKNKKDALNEFFIKNNEYLKKNSRINLELAKNDKKALKVFSIILMKSNWYLMYGYLFNRRIFNSH